MIDRILKDLALNDSEIAFSKIFEYYKIPISRYIYMYVKNSETTEEILSDVFFALWEQRKKLLEIDNLLAYLYQISKFKCLNHLRKKNIQIVNLNDIPLDVFACTTTTPENQYISKENIEYLNSVIEQLPSKCKLAFKLVREDKLSYQEAAIHLNVSVKTIEYHISIATRKIREALKNKEK